MNPSASSRPTGPRPPVREQPHALIPLIPTLEQLGVPFFAYGVDGRRIAVSDAAESLISAEAFAAGLGDISDRIAAQEPSLGGWNPRGAAFTSVREVPACGGRLVLGLTILNPAVGSVAAIVVISPRLVNPSATHRLHGLTPREDGVARLIAAGFATKQIACRLGISAHTARHHTERIFAKLAVRSRAAVAALVGGDTQSLPLTI
jgi:DNA-binding CsgD family transcriptional regulator